MVERVVFDTNVWISGLLWRGKPHQCLLLARAGAVRPIYCDATLNELLEKLLSSFRFSLEDIDLVKEEIQAIGECVKVRGTVRAVSSDPDDDMFIESALVGGARFVVSGDKHLLELTEYEGIRMITPAEFLKQMSGV